MVETRCIPYTPRSSRGRQTRLRPSQAPRRSAGVGAARDRGPGRPGYGRRSPRRSSPCPARAAARRACAGSIAPATLRPHRRRRGRAAECSGFENRQVERPQGFESSRLRHCTASHAVASSSMSPDCMHSSPVGPPWDPSCPTARSRTESRCDLRCLTKHGAKRAARGVHGPETGSGVGEAGRAVTAWSACTPWHLQFWYRYSNLDATSNTANGVSIRFCP